MKSEKQSHRAISTVLIAIAFCVIGTFVFYHSTLLSGFRLMQTDFGDPRLNNYFLEHSFQWLANPDYTGSLWSPSFFYPADEVLTYSDNLFGSAPIYWLFRAFSSATAAFQLWMITVSALTFFSFFYLLKTFKIGDWFSGLGSFLFTYGLPRAGQLSHHQLLPQFFTPLAIIAAIDFIKRPRKRSFIALLVFCYFQVLAGVYLGWFLLLSLPIFLVVVCVVNADGRRRLLDYWRAKKIFLISSTLGWLLATGLTLLPYIRRSLSFGGRTYAEVDALTPRLNSWFSVAPETLWSPLLSWTAKGLPGPHEHRLFLGFTVLFLSFACLRYLWRKDAGSVPKANDSAPGGPVLSDQERWLVKACFYMFVIFFLLSVRLPCGFFGLVPCGHSLWRIIYEAIPGASAIRAPTRVWTIAYCFLLPAILLWADRMIWRTVSSRRQGMFAVGLVCAIAMSEQVIIDQINFDKHVVNAEVAEIESLIQTQCDAVYLSFNPEKPFYAEQLSTMWAGINTNVPIINGYSGWSPLEYKDITQPMTTEEVVAWLNLPQNINNLAEKNLTPEDLQLCLLGEASVLESDEFLQRAAISSTINPAGSLSVYRMKP